MSCNSHECCPSWTTSLTLLGSVHRLTCVFLATKTENHPISIDSFSSKTRTTPDDILSLEFLISQSLRFEYKVHHAHLAASGLLLDMQVMSHNLPLPFGHFLTILDFPSDNRDPSRNPRNRLRLSQAASPNLPSNGPRAHLHSLANRTRHLPSHRPLHRRPLAGHQSDTTSLPQRRPEVERSDRGGFGEGEGRGSVGGDWGGHLDGEGDSGG